MQIESYKVGIYCRLSREDGNEESQSISAQKEILTEYVSNQGWKIYDVYCDDGYSGTNYDRPAFKRLINDIEYGNINLVITKDLSRLGRNYIQTGYYTEEYFPENDVRFIALNDNFDTLKEDNDFIPFKNIINEWYAKDISKKIRFTLDNKAKSGEPRNTVFPLFGYTYNEKYERVPCPETAPIVRFIFEEYLKTASTSKVAKALTDKRVKIPAYYNAVKYNYNKEKVLARSEEELCKWSTSTIKDILKRKEYLGIYITAQSKSKNFKLKKRYKNQDKYEFEGKYEAIITEEQFNMAQKLMKRSRSGDIPYEENIYKGILLCADCGKPLRFQRRTDRKGSMYYRYYCENKNCDYFNNIQQRELNDIIKYELVRLKEAILNNKKLFIEMIKNKDNTVKFTSLENNIDVSSYIKRNNEIDNYIKKLFEAYTDGKVPESTYDMMMEKYTKEKRLLETQIRELTIEEKKNMVTRDYNNEAKMLVEALEKIDDEHLLTSQFLLEVIKSIQVKNLDDVKFSRAKKKIIITYQYVNDEIKEYLENEKCSCNIC